MDVPRSQLLLMPLCLLQLVIRVTRRLAAPRALAAHPRIKGGVMMMMTVFRTPMIRTQ